MTCRVSLSEDSTKCGLSEVVISRDPKAEDRPQIMLDIFTSGSSSVMENCSVIELPSVVNMVDCDTRLMVGGTEGETERNM